MPRATGSLDRGISLRTVVADATRKLEVWSAAGTCDPGRARRADVLLRRSRELDQRLSRWGMNTTTNDERGEDLLEVQDLLAEVRRLDD